MLLMFGCEIELQALFELGFFFHWWNIDVSFWYHPFLLCFFFSRSLKIGIRVQFLANKLRTTEAKYRQ